MPWFSRSCWGARFGKRVQPCSAVHLLSNVDEPLQMLYGVTSGLVWANRWRKQPFRYVVADRSSGDKQSRFVAKHRVCCVQQFVEREWGKRPIILNCGHGESLLPQRKSPPEGVGGMRITRKVIRNRLRGRKPTPFASILFLPHLSVFQSHDLYGQTKIRLSSVEVSTHLVRTSELRV